MLLKIFIHPMTPTHHFVRLYTSSSVLYRCPSPPAPFGMKDHIHPRSTAEAASSYSFQVAQNPCFYPPGVRLLVAGRKLRAIENGKAGGSAAPARLPCFCVDGICFSSVFVCFDQHFYEGFRVLD